jgi:predicted flap endonuclease-1-like 5' DNA nuclease
MSRIVAFVAGLLIGALVGRQRSVQPQVQYGGPDTRPSPVPPAPPSPPAAAPADALTDIEGIGPTFEQALNKLGIHTFVDLSRQNADDLAVRLSARVTADRIRRDRWIEQAQERAKSDS